MINKDQSHKMIRRAYHPTRTLLSKTHITIVFLFLLTHLLTSVRFRSNRRDVRKEVAENTLNNAFLTLRTVEKESRRTRMTCFVSVFPRRNSLS